MIRRSTKSLQGDRTSKRKLQTSCEVLKLTSKGDLAYRNLFIYDKYVLEENKKNETHSDIKCISYAERNSTLVNQAQSEENSKAHSFLSLDEDCDDYDDESNLDIRSVIKQETRNMEEGGDTYSFLKNQRPDTMTSNDMSSDDVSSDDMSGDDESMVALLSCISSTKRGLHHRSARKKADFKVGDMNTMTHFFGSPKNERKHDSDSFYQGSDSNSNSCSFDAIESDVTIEEEPLPFNSLFNSIVNEPSISRETLSPIVSFLISYKAPRNAYCYLGVCGDILELGFSLNPSKTIGELRFLTERLDGDKDLWESKPIVIRSVKPKTTILYRYFVILSESPITNSDYSKGTWKVEGSLISKTSAKRFSSRSFILPQVEVFNHFSKEEQKKKCHFCVLDKKYNLFSEPVIMSYSELEDTSDDSQLSHDI